MITFCFLSITEELYGKHADDLNHELPLPSQQYSVMFCVLCDTSAIVLTET